MARGYVKRSRGPDGTYMEGFEEIPGVPVAPLKIIVEFAHISSCTLSSESFQGCAVRISSRSNWY